ncbi:MAG: alpha/beta hydrolase [Lachnospiraceae bacterium]|nr:alpha/beta hydrolase [Lachnospiraceae bacterium]
MTKKKKSNIPAVDYRLIRLIFSMGDRRRDKGLTTPKDIVRYDNIPYGEDPVYQLLDVYRPKCGEKSRAAGGEAEQGLLPVIINVHGGSWVYGDKEGYQYYCMHLAQQGFAVVNFSYRLAPRHRYPAALWDVQRVFAWTAEHAGQYGLDLENLFLTGDSAGAQLASQYLTALTNAAYWKQLGFPGLKQPLRVRAAGFNCGVFDISRHCKEGRIPLLEAYLGKGWERHSHRLEVLSHISTAFPPTFITTAKGDFLKEDSIAFYEYLKSRGIPCQYKMYGQPGSRGTGHVFHLNLRLAESRKHCEEQCGYFRGMIRGVTIPG